MCPIICYNSVTESTVCHGLGLCRNNCDVSLNQITKNGTESPVIPTPKSQSTDHKQAYNLFHPYFYKAHQGILRCSLVWKSLVEKTRWGE